MEKYDPIKAMAIAHLTNVLKGKYARNEIESAKVKLPEPPKTKLGRIKFTKWAKRIKKSGHPWWEIACKHVEENI
jgi:hypothetical protein